MAISAVLLDFSGTLFRLEQDETWLADLTDHEGEHLAIDIRPAFTTRGWDAYVDTFVLSFEVGSVKPEPEIFRKAVRDLGVPAAETLMVGDSEEADGGARALGCEFALVDPLPTADRP